MTRYLAVLGALLISARAGAHQETVAYSRMVIRETGEVEYALKIPVEDLAETLGRTGHAALNAPEVRGAEELLFHHFAPLVGITSGDVPCPMERKGIDVPEDERLYGELRFVFHCPAGAPVTLDYRVFFDIDPGHMGMLEIESAGGKARAELIVERKRWQIAPSADGPPRIRALEGSPDPAEETTGAPVPAPPSVLEPRRSAENARRAAEHDTPRVATAEERAKPALPTQATAVFIALVLLVGAAAAFHVTRVVRRSQ